MAKPGSGARKRTLKLGIHYINCGDGSASAKLFKNEAAAERYAEKHDNGERFCDDVSTIEIKLDENGQFIPEPDDDED